MKTATFKWQDELVKHIIKEIETNPDKDWTTLIPVGRHRREEQELLENKNGSEIQECVAQESFKVQ